VVCARDRNLGECSGLPAELTRHFRAYVGAQEHLGVRLVAQMDLDDVWRLFCVVSVSSSMSLSSLRTNKHVHSLMATYLDCP
jgi:hypothetical protein